MKLGKIALKDKRGLGIGDLYPIILTIAVVGILLGIIFIILTSWQDVTNNVVGNVFNETTAAVDETGTPVANVSACGFTDMTVSLVTNISNGTIIPSASYVVASTGSLSFTGADTSFNNSPWNVTYSYEFGGEDCEALSAIVSDYSDFVPWIGIILLVIAAAIVLGVVISSFRGNSRV